MNERRIMSDIDHPFCVPLIATFKVCANQQHPSMLHSAHHPRDSRLIG